MTERGNPGTARKLIHAPPIAPMSSESYDSVLLLACQLKKGRIRRYVRNTNGPSKQRHGSRRECLVVEITFETFPELGVLL